MRLVRFRVLKFRSITKSTDWIEVDDLNCFVGLNEAGKSNILLALWKFNPANTDDQRSNIDLFTDYPREEYEGNVYKEIFKKNAFIMAVFKVKKEEMDNILERSSLNSAEKGQFNFLTIEFKFQKDYNGKLTVTSEDRQFGNPKVLKAINGIIRKIAGQLIESLPKFIYHSQYKEIASIIDIMKKKLSSVEMELLKALDLKKQDIEDWIEREKESRPNYEALKKYYDEKLLSAGKTESQKFQKWWFKNGYQFQFKMDNMGRISIFVRSKDDTQFMPLDSRSPGMRWLFNFFLMFWQHNTSGSQNSILLLDEPGLHLHPNAQEELVSIFKELSQKNQLLYSTHSPFLVDHDQLESVKTVYLKSDNGSTSTKVTNDIAEDGDSNIATKTIYNAIGIAEGFLLDYNIVVVEGKTDQIYLNMIQKYLKENDKNRDNTNLFFMSANGATNVSVYASVVHQIKKELPVCLLDSDQAGDDAAKKLGKLYNTDVKKGKIIRIGPFAKPGGSEIEDLIPTELIIDCFNSLFKSVIGKEVALNQINKENAIICQLEDFAGWKDSSPTGWKPRLAKKVVENFNSQEKLQILENFPKMWKELFENIEESLTTNKEKEPA